MRRVEVSKYEKNPTGTYFDKVPDGEGLFHCWGLDYELFDTGPGCYSVAIIERDDGSVESVSVTLIRFKESPDA